MQFNDGEVNPSWEVPMERLRGIDIGDLWQSSQDIRRKFKKAISDDIAASANNLNN